MQSEFELGGVAYRADKLDVFAQLHVSRKIFPIVPKLIPIFVMLQKASAATGDAADAGIATALRDDLPGLAEAAGPFADALAGMSNADVEFVINTCLSVVRRNQNGMWSVLAGPGGLMYADLGLEQVLPIVVRVLRENLGNFIQGLLANQAPTPAAPAQVG